METNAPTPASTLAGAEESEPNENRRKALARSVAKEKRYRRVWPSLDDQKANGDSKMNVRKRQNALPKAAPVKRPDYMEVLFMMKKEETKKRAKEEAEELAAEQAQREAARHSAVELGEKSESSTDTSSASTTTVSSSEDSEDESTDEDSDSVDDEAASEMSEVNSGQSEDAESLEPETESGELGASQLFRTDSDSPSRYAYIPSVDEASCLFTNHGERASFEQVDVDCTPQIRCRSGTGEHHETVSLKFSAEDSESLGAFELNDSDSSESSSDFEFL